MMAYIDKEMLERLFNRHEWGTCDERWRPESEFGKFVDAIPTADVAEVKHGKWDVVADYNVPLYGVCSVCGGTAICDEYCGKCGAKMDGGEE